MRVLAALMCILMGLAVSACGSSTTTSSVSAAGAPTAPGSTTTLTATTTAPSSVSGATATATSATAAGPSACVAADLALGFLGAQGATGHGLLGFSLRNTSGRPCRTYGYPGIQFLDQAGHALPTASTRTTHDFFGSVPTRRIVLASGHTASFRIGVTHVPTGDQTCTTAGSLQVIPPDDTATLRVGLPNGAYECGTATVSPLQPGNSAYGPGG